MPEISASAASFILHLSKLRFENSFNPYSDRCESFDLPDATEIRRRNLEVVLRAALRDGVDSLWVARDLGYRGGRRTGLALTDDVHLADHARMFGVRGVARATKEPPLAEATARVIWRALNQIEERIFLWNVFPLHPHKSSAELSNRSHTRHERDTCAPLVTWLVQGLKPKRLVAIGADAHIALEALGYSCDRVRHPSYGGQSVFIEGVSRLYDVNIA